MTEITQLEESELSRRVGRAFLEIEGLAEGFDETIHAADEMFLRARLAEAGPRCARLQYYRDGREVVQSLRNVLDAAGRTLGSCGRVLEMGCGYGRVTRHLVRELPAECITTAEFLEPAVAFVGETFGVDARLSSMEPGALDVGQGFDLILVNSLFLHLSRERFGEWLETLYGALGPRGLLVFSTHGTAVFPEVTQDPSGFTFVPEGGSPGPWGSDYGSTFVTREVVSQLARERGVAHLASVDRDLWMLQDLHVASRAPTRGFEAWRNVSFVQGVVDRILIEDGEFHVGGWAADTRLDMPMQSVRLLINGGEVARIPVDQLRVDVARSKGRSDWLYSGWALDGRMPELPPGEHLLAARGVSATGATSVIDILPVMVPPP